MKTISYKTLFDHKNERLFETLPIDGDFFKYLFKNFFIRSESKRGNNVQQNGEWAGSKHSWPNTAQLTPKYIVEPFMEHKS